MGHMADRQPSLPLGTLRSQVLPPRPRGPALQGASIADEAPLPVDRTPPQYTSRSKALAASRYGPSQGRGRIG